MLTSQLKSGIPFSASRFGCDVRGRVDEGPLRLADHLSPRRHKVSPNDGIRGPAFDALTIKWGCTGLAVKNVASNRPLLVEVHDRQIGITPNPNNPLPRVESEGLRGRLGGDPDVIREGQ